MSSVFFARRAQIFSRYSVTNVRKVMTAGSGGGAGGEALPLISAQELAVPGFRAALHYPYFIPRQDDWFTAFCWYCGRVSDVPGRQVCTDCHGRHEPRPHLGEDGIPELNKEE